MRVREATASEWALLRDLRLRALREDPPAFGQRLEDALAFDDDKWRAYAAGERHATFVADDGRALVGMARGFLTDDSAIAGLYGMWVAPEARGAGAGRALGEAVLGWARARGASRVVLHVAEDRLAARRTYHALGFAETGRIEPPMAHHPGVPLREMARTLEVSTTDSRWDGTMQAG